MEFVSRVLGGIEKATATRAKLGMLVLLATLMGAPAARAQICNVAELRNAISVIAGAACKGRNFLEVVSCTSSL